MVSRAGATVIVLIALMKSSGLECFLPPLPLAGILQIVVVII
jgi:hypothetical protein